jgi:P-type Ca2+ transporter type 2B
VHYTYFFNVFVMF